MQHSSQESARKRRTRGYEYFTSELLRVLAGMYIPSCDEDGYYRKVQCDQSRGECWCVDQHGGELMGSRIHGNPDCGTTGGVEKSESGPNVCVGFEPESHHENIGSLPDLGFMKTVIILKCFQIHV